MNKTHDSEYKEKMTKLLDLCERFKADSSFRAEIEQGNPEYLIGICPEDYKGELILKTNTADTVYFVLPTIPNRTLTEEEVRSSIAGAKFDFQIVNDPNITFEQTQEAISIGAALFIFTAIGFASKIHESHPEYFYESTIILKGKSEYYNSLK